MLIAMENANKDAQHERDTWQPLRTASAQLLRRLHESTCPSPAATGEKSDAHERNDERREGHADRKNDNCYICHLERDRRI
jgi:hypothetical protein